MCYCTLACKLFTSVFYASSADVVRFDNTYSWTRSKKVHYVIEILEPDVDDFDMPSDTVSESSSLGACGVAS